VRDDASIAWLEGRAAAERDDLDPFAGPRAHLYPRRQMASAPSVQAVPFGSRWRTQCERSTGGVNRTFGELYDPARRHVVEGAGKPDPSGSAKRPQLVRPYGLTQDPILPLGDRSG
jgi:hypothetical protein